ncbi:Thioredoxin 2 [bacterium HR40]|nr:Thioredoxin 2 [bacterium HR40]
MTALRHVVCPHCHTINRLPEGRDFRAARCGKCRGRLFEGRPVDLDARHFRSFLEGHDVPVLVDLWAPWCPPCRALAPVIEELARRREPEIRVAKLDIDRAPDLAESLRVTAVPTLLLYHRGQEVARHSGLLSRAALEAWIASHLGDGERMRRAAGS